MYSRKKLYPSCCRMLQSFKKQYLKTNHIQFSGIKLHEMINVSCLAVSYVLLQPYLSQRLETWRCSLSRTAWKLGQRQNAGHKEDKKPLPALRFKHQTQSSSPLLRQSIMFYPLVMMLKRALCTLHVVYAALPLAWNLCP